MKRYVSMNRTSTRMIYPKQLHGRANVQVMRDDRRSGTDRTAGYIVAESVLNFSGPIRYEVCTYNATYVAAAVSGASSYRKGRSRSLRTMAGSEIHFFTLAFTLIRL